MPCKQGKTRVLLVSATLCSRDSIIESSWELPWLGKVSAVARRAVSKTRRASPWQSNCMKEMWNLIQAVLLTGNVWSMTDQGPWWIRGLWLSYTAVQEHSQDWTQYATQIGQHWCDPALLPGGKPWEHLAFSSRPDFPDRDDFSAAWPILGGLSLLQPQAVHLFLYLHYRPMSANKTTWALPWSASALCQG